MNPNCYHVNPLRRDGTSQTQRLLETLRPESVDIDEREYTDLLHFAREYAAQLNYYDLSDTDTGANWQAFFENDTVLCADIIHTEMKDRQAAFDALVVAARAGGAIQTDFEALLTDAVAGLVPMAREIDALYVRAESGSDLQLALDKLIRQFGAPALLRMAELDKAGDIVLNAGSGDPALSGDDYTGYSTPWGITDLTGVTADTAAYTGTPLWADAITPLAGLFRAFSSLIARMKGVAADQLEVLMNDWPYHEPHFALFLTFLKIFRYAQDHLNTLTARQLDYYYQEVLQLFNRDAVPTQAHVIFELAKGVDSVRVAQGTQLKAGKDSLGKAITFETDDEIVVNRAGVADLRSVYIGPDADNGKVRIFAGPVANSLDGRGEPLDDAAPEWNAFGEARQGLDLDDDGIVDLFTMEQARLGFAIASPQFWAREGERLYTLELSLDGITSNDVSALCLFLTRSTNIRITGEEGWIVPDSYGSVLSSYSQLAGPFPFQIPFGLSQDLPAVAPYNPEIHGGTYDTHHPVVEILLDAETQAPDILAPLADVLIRGFKIDLSVNGITDLMVQNDEGELDVTKPFTPFTSDPEPGANFYIGSAEVFSKHLRTLDIRVEWMGVPTDNFQHYYRHYVSKHPTPTVVNAVPFITGINGGFKARAKLLDDFIWKDLIQESGVQSVYVMNSVPGSVLSVLLHEELMNGNLSNTGQAGNIGASGNRISQDCTPGGVYLPHADGSAGLVSAYAAGDLSYHLSCMPSLYQNYSNKLYLFDAVDPRSYVDYHFDQLNFSHAPQPFVARRDFSEYTRDPDLYELDSYEAGTRRGFMKLELDSNFLRDIYPKVLTESSILSAEFVSRGNASGLDLPNEPYTPIMKSIRLNYTSDVTVNYTTLSTDDYSRRVEKLYHVAPYGEVEIFPATQTAVLPSEAITTKSLIPALPEHDLGLTGVDDEAGILYIGVEEFDAPQTLSLLFQMADGTEDPSKDKQTVTWYYLSKNQWKAFSDRQIALDTTENLLHTGIVRFSVPAGANEENTLMPAGKVWVKAEVSGNITAFPKFIDVRAQAVSATFADNDNDPKIMAEAFAAGTITGLKERIFGIRKLEQPYKSFGGKLKEESDEFYRRVSERLRHKHRAGTIRDYEHIVLEAFPEVFKVKCANHTDDVSELSPGKVTVLLIPEVKNFNALENPYQPKFGSRTLVAVSDYLAKITTPFLDLDVRNPLYEEIETTFNVRFHEGYDVAYYKRQLDEDIRNFISPWATGSLESLRFGGSLHESWIINFIEERPYVDYLTDFEMRLDGQLTQEAFASTVGSILVTALNHNITEIA